MALKRITKELKDINRLIGHFLLSHCFDKDCRQSGESWLPEMGGRPRLTRKYVKENSGTLAVEVAVWFFKWRFAKMRNRAGHR